jgi:hypothetical protein
MSPVLKASESISRTSLDNAENRAITFLKGSCSSQRIALPLEAAGFTKRARAEGFRLYFKVVGYSPLDASATPTEGESAFDAIQAWEQTGFARSRAALQHKHPEVALYVFAGLVAVRGPAALGALATFLDRCQSLESSPERKATTDIEAPPPAVEPLNAAERKESQVALYLWIQGWSETARAVITNRADLIRLGIAKPRRAKAATPVKPAVVAPAPAPAPPPVAPVTGAQELEDHGPSSRAA